jgi:pimeloyl-ACP methyl ester carboxylesterase
MPADPDGSRQPVQWPAPIARTRHVVLAFRGHSPAQLRTITAPALVVAGDADAIPTEHTVEMARLLPHARLAILPGVDHGTVTQQVQLLTATVPAVLDAADPDAMWHAHHQQAIAP